MRESVHRFVLLEFFVMQVYRYSRLPPSTRIIKFSFLMTAARQSSLAQVSATSLFLSLAKHTLQSLYHPRRSRETDDHSPLIVDSSYSLVGTLGIALVDEIYSSIHTIIGSASDAIRIITSVRYTLE